MLRPRRSTAAFVVLFALLSGGCMPEQQDAERIVASAPEHLVTGALGGRTSVFLAITDASSRVEVTLADLPGTLYRVSTPGDSGLAPVVRSSGNEIFAGFRTTTGDGADTARIVLNRDVRWAIRLPGGTGEERLDLRGGDVAGVQAGACGLAEIDLPGPAGTVPVTFTAGMGTVAITSPRVPAGIVLHGGSGHLVTPWGARPATDPGASVYGPGVAAARDRYAITAYGAIGTLTLDQTG